MSIVSNTLLAFSMSTDAFAASIGKGVAMRRPHLIEAAKIGAIFGLIETITPVAGWIIGLAASGFVQEVDHWIAFCILSVVGGRMIYLSRVEKAHETRPKHTLSTTILTAIGTSIDAMAVGASLAFVEINIWVIAAMIGAATFLMSTIGIMAGNRFGDRVGKIAEALGGLCLIGIGTKILIQHLSGLA